MATRYWVGGTGTWDSSSTTNWSDTSGGSGGFSAPTAVDDVIFNSLSGLGIVTTDATAIANSITYNTSTLTSLTLGAALDISGSTSGIITLTSGTINTNNQNLSIKGFSSDNSNTRSLILGSSTITLNGNWNIGNSSTSTGMTLSAGTSTIQCIANTGLFYGGGLTYYNLSFDNGTSNATYEVRGLNIFNNLSIKAATSITDAVPTITFIHNQVINGTLSTINTSPTLRVAFKTGTYFNNPTIITITAASVSLVGVNIRGVTAGGSTPWTGTSLANLGNTSNITFDAVKTVYWSLVGGGNWTDNAWATTSGGIPDAANIPLPGDTVIFDDTGLNTSSTVVVDAGYQQMFSNYMPSINCTRVNAWTCDFGSTVSSIIFFDANITLTSATTTLGSSICNLLGTNTLTINCSFIPSLSIGANYSTPLNFTTSVTLGSNFTSTSTTSYYGGTLNLNNFIFSCYDFYSNSSNTKSIKFGTGNITITGTVFNTTGSFTSTTGNALVNISNTGPATTINITHQQLNFKDQCFGFNITTGSHTINFISGANLATIRSLDFTGFTGTWNRGSNTNAIELYGDITCVSGMTTTGTGTIYFFKLSTSGTAIFTTAGVMDNIYAIYQSPVSNTVTNLRLVGNLSCTIYQLNKGILDLATNNAILTCNSFISNLAENRTINFGTSGINLSGTNASINIANGGYMSITGTPTINMTVQGTCSISVGVASTQAASFNFNINGADNLNIVSSSTPANRSRIKNLDLTSFTGTLTLDNLEYIFYGNITLSSSMTFIPGNSTVLCGGSPSSIQSNGKSFYTVGVFNDTGNIPSLSLIDDITCTESLVVSTNGIFNANNKNVTTRIFTSTSITSRTITMGSGTWTLTGSGTVWNINQSGLVFNKNTANIFLTNATNAASITFVGAGLTYNNLYFNGGSATGQTYNITNTATSTFNGFYTNKTVAWTLTLPSSRTTNVSSWGINGTSGNLVTLNSSTAGTRATLNKVGAYTTADYMDIKDISATPSSRWYATNSIDSGNNSGWVFGFPSTGASYFLMF